jgi:signal peptidase I
MEENNFDTENNELSNSVEVDERIQKTESDKVVDKTETGETMQKAETDAPVTKKSKRKKKEEKEEFNLKKEIFSWIRIFIIAIVIAFCVNNFIIMNANVPSGSMEQTIHKKDRMIGLRTSYWFSDPKRGDIVIFINPDYNEEGSTKSDKYFVKRVIGLPGDKIVIKNAKIYINDSSEPLDEPYLPEEWIYVNGDDEPLEYNVPDDCYFMLGDNRNNSSDARFWINTYVKRDKIVAKAQFKYWSEGKIDFEVFDKVTYDE